MNRDLPIGGLPQDENDILLDSVRPTISITNITNMFSLFKLSFSCEMRHFLYSREMFINSCLVFD